MRIAGAGPLSPCPRDEPRAFRSDTLDLHGDLGSPRDPGQYQGDGSDAVRVSPQGPRSRGERRLGEHLGRGAGGERLLQSPSGIRRPVRRQHARRRRDLQRRVQEPPRHLRSSAEMDAEELALLQKMRGSMGSAGDAGADQAEDASRVERFLLDELRRGTQDLKGSARPMRRPSASRETSWRSSSRGSSPSSSARPMSPTSTSTTTCRSSVATTRCSANCGTRCRATTSSPTRPRCSSCRSSDATPT